MPNRDEHSAQAAVSSAAPGSRISRKNAPRTGTDGSMKTRVRRKISGNDNSYIAYFSLPRTRILTPLSGTTPLRRLFPGDLRSFHRDKTELLRSDAQGRSIGRIKQEKTGMGGAWTADDPRGYSKTHPPGI